MAKSIPACNRLTVQKKLAAFMTGIRTKKVPHSPVSKITWFSLKLDFRLVPFPLMFPKESLRVKRINSVSFVSDCCLINSLKFDNVTLGM